MKQLLEWVLLNPGIVALLLSAIGIGISCTVAYQSFFKRANPKMIVDRRLFFYNLPFKSQTGMVWGGIGFYLPITFHNWSPTAATILDVRLLIKRQDSPDKVFDMSWNEFQVLSKDGDR